MRLALLDLEHSVHQQEGVAVRQLLEDLVDVHHDSVMCFLLALRRFFQRLEPFAQRVQLLERGGVLFPGRIVVDGKDAGVMAGLEDGARHQRRRGDVDVVGDGQVAQDARARRRWCSTRRSWRCRPRRRSRPWPCACRCGRCGRSGSGCRASRRPRSRCRCQRAAVDAGVGADLDVVADAHRAQLLDLFPGALVSGAKPKPSAPITTPGCMMQRVADHAVLAHARRAT